ncbi:hypothetical protein VCO01S_24420 [Vibrio comitans NBRC 102076]|uniref:Uncharacterized protein n=1 Tax=Vibrio comitans NBRC 102076 TaxID=1219078 RepID=A0A4Y3IP18_9VIBR|nr:hypothetical protein VCO01S_24420 [Vibrio comitans NBRC 102076]
MLEELQPARAINNTIDIKCFIYLPLMGHTKHEPSEFGRIYSNVGGLALIDIAMYADKQILLGTTISI